MSAFKPLNVKKYFRSAPEVSPDAQYWKRLGVPTLVKEFGAIDYIDFSPIEPHYFAVTCSVRVQIYNPITKLVVKNLSRFQENAYGGTFRQDGHLLVAGDQEGSVRLFDIASRNVLRVFKGHSAPVHRTNFTSDLFHITSFSDDKTVKLWDISAEKCIGTYTAHNDYVRAGSVNPVSTNIFVSGGYDGKINLYDTRNEKISCTVDHGCPVESLIFLPSGSIFISAGGTEIRVWDAFAGCRLLTKMSPHHKTITCLRLGSKGKRILSSGLDRHVKIYDVASYRVVHSLSFPNSVLSLGLAPDNQSLVAGMVDGLVSIQNMETGKSNERRLQRSFQLNNNKMHKRATTLHIDHKIPFIKAVNMEKYNDYLRKFEYVRCLDTVMHGTFVHRHTEVTVTVLQELIHRKGLRRALTARPHRFLRKFIFFLRRYIGEQRFMRVLIDVTNVLLDVYEDSFDEFNEDLQLKFIDLADALQLEMALSYNLLEFQGALELIFAASDVSNVNENAFVHFVDDKKKVTLIQSKLAAESSILNVERA